MDISNLQTAPSKIIARQNAMLAPPLLYFKNESPFLHAY